MKTRQTAALLVVGFLLAAACAGAAPSPSTMIAPPPAKAVTSSAVSVVGTPRRNVILFIGDGMGSAQIEATRRFASGNARPLAMERLPEHGELRTGNAFGAITDSAAAATAIATGHKVANGVISVADPGDGTPLATALEILAAGGLWTGLVTVDTAITDATPAAFGAHVANRSQQSDIAAAYMGASMPNVLIGAPGGGLDEAALVSAGYEIVSEAAAEPDADHVAWLLPEERKVTLADLTRLTLRILDVSPRGFFVVIEHEGPDNWGHDNDLAGVIGAVLELDSAVAAAVAWAEGRTDTLIVVTADHETGGLVLASGVPQRGEIPNHEYTTGGHTDTPVSIFASGPGSETVTLLTDLTGLFPLLTDR